LQSGAINDQSILGVSDYTIRSNPTPSATTPQKRVSTADDRQDGAARLGSGVSELELFGAVPEGRVASPMMLVVPATVAMTHCWLVPPGMELPMMSLARSFGCHSAAPPVHAIRVSHLESCVKEISMM
jgi:hypothetical protein